MKPRPPQSKHASSLPLTARSADLSISLALAQFPPSGEAPGLRAERYRYSSSPLAAASHVACEITLKKSYRIAPSRIVPFARSRDPGDLTGVVRENESGEKVREEDKGG